MDKRQEQITLGQSYRMAFDWHINHGLPDNLDEFLAELTATARRFYATIIDSQQRLVGAPADPNAVPPPVEAAQRAAQAAEPPPEAYAPSAAELMPEAAYAPPAEPGSAGTMDSSGLMNHRADKWSPTNIRCPRCAMFSLVINKTTTGPEYECASRSYKPGCGIKGVPKNQQGHHHTNDCYVTEGCEYVKWRDDD